MKNKKTVALLLLNLGILTAKAQQTVTTTGGNASGSGGNIAYSVGQIVYTTITASNGSRVEGVQQPYEITISSETTYSQINPNIQVYPNPTTDYVTLNISNVELSSLDYQLYDILGKLIENKKITNTTETIPMANFTAAIYFLKITNNTKALKTFKIIKR